MNDRFERLGFAMAMLIGGALYAWRFYVTPITPPLPPPPLAQPAPPPAPAPKPCPGPFCPTPRPRPKEGAEPGKPVIGGKVSPDGTEEITCDLDRNQKFNNKGGRDGSGLCVFASITYAARYQNEKKLLDFFEKMRKEPGGGYPSKVDKMIEKYGPGTQYVQYEGADKSMAFLRAAIKSGRSVSVTYNGHDPHYGGSISHMVWMPHLSERWACISDNNHPEDNQFVWMSPEEFYKRWAGNGKGWAVALLSPPPPPPPKGKT